MEKRSHNDRDFWTLMLKFLTRSLPLPSSISLLAQIRRSRLSLLRFI